MNIVQERVVIVLQRMIEMAKSDEDDAIMFSDCLETMLDNISSEDGFGTEGQTDPRGDQRNGEWSMEHVQGIDSDLS